MQLRTILNLKVPTSVVPAMLSRMYTTGSGSADTNTLAPIKKVTVFGAGLMGSGIAQVAAMNDHSVNLVDISPDSLNKGQGYILKSLKRIAKKKFADDHSSQIQFTENVLSRIEFTSKAEDAVPSADLVIEAVIEDINLKQKIFKNIDELAPKEAIFASNTSSLPIKDVFSTVSQSRLANTGGLHFFNPVSQMKLVEIIKTDNTSEETFKKLHNFSLALKKAPVSCKDTPGFIVNRLLVPYMMEAIRLLERGDASARDIDTAMKLGAGYPMGPFELLDYVGLDTVYYVMKGWDQIDELKKTGITVQSKMLEDLVNAGRLGVKSGAGFYEYTKK